MPCESTDDFFVRPIVILPSLFGPSCKLDPRLESIEGQTASVEFASAWDRKERSGDDATGGLANASMVKVGRRGDAHSFGYGNGLVARNEEFGDILENWP